MKIIINSFLLLLMLHMYSCEKSKSNMEACADKLPCTGDCLFTIENMEARTLYLGCFDRWGFVFPNPENPEYFSAAIPDEWDDVYMNDSIDIIVCGIARANKIPILFPDPGFSSVYQVDVKGVEKK